MASRIAKPTVPFVEFPKIPRLNREVIVTEKIDGTNATVFIRRVCAACLLDDITPADGSAVACPRCGKPTETTIHAASRNKWIDEDDDNHGFARWVADHAKELLALGPGLHRGEWHGPGINRAHYGLPKGEKRFYLFNTSRWSMADVLKTDQIGPYTLAKDAPKSPPACCGVVPVLYRGPLDTKVINDLVEDLRKNGSRAYPGQKAEGVVIFHVAANQFYKVTCENDEVPKALVTAQGLRGEA